MEREGEERKGKGVNLGNIVKKRGINDREEEYGEKEGKERERWEGVF